MNTFDSIVIVVILSHVDNETYRDIIYTGYIHKQSEMVLAECSQNVFLVGSQMVLARPP